MADMRDFSWHIENLFEQETDIQVIPLHDALEVEKKLKEKLPREFEPGDKEITTYALVNSEGHIHMTHSKDSDYFDLSLPGWWKHGYQIVKLTGILKPLDIKGTN